MFTQFESMWDVNHGSIKTVQHRIEVERMDI